MSIKYFTVVLISVLVSFFATYTAANEKICRFMTPKLDGLVRLQTRDLWNPLTGYFCYNYTPDFRLNFIYESDIIEINNYAINVTWIDNRTYFWYDYTNETSLYYVRRSYKNDVFFEKWKTCCEEAAQCCDFHMTSENIFPNDEYPCPAVWDSWTCFPPAKANTVSKMLCPTVTFSAEVRSCELLSQKQCLTPGFWNPFTDYDICSFAPVFLSRHNFHITILAVAAGLCAPAVLIFFSFRAFRHKLTFVLHRNLILIIIVRNLLTIMSKEIIIKDELTSEDLDNTVMGTNSVACRVLAFFENVSKNGMFSCMLADGFYLHKSIVRPFASDPKLIFIYSVVLLLSFVPSLIWALLRGLNDGKYCWMVDSSKDQWVSDGFRFAILGVNTILLLDILRVMVTKLKGSGISKQTKTTVRVTMFLIPLFGIHIIFISNRDIVPGDTCSAQDVYYYISYSFEGLQGILVSVLFCYINPEVRHELMNALRKIIISLQQCVDVNFRNENLLKRRPTTATYVETVEETNS